MFLDVEIPFIFGHCFLLSKKIPEIYLMTNTDYFNQTSVHLCLLKHTNCVLE